MLKYIEVRYSWLEMFINMAAKNSIIELEAKEWSLQVTCHH